jgi:hypothetical protein
MSRQDRPSTAVPYFMMNQVAVRSALAAEAERDYRTHEIRLLVEQMLGPVVVNEFSINYRIGFDPCDPDPENPEEDDFVDLNSNDGGDQAVVLLDGRRRSLEGDTVCVSDMARRGSGLLGIGNMHQGIGCNEETVVFSDDDRMVLARPVPAWIGSSGNRQSLTLSDRRLGDVTIWIMQPPFSDTEARAIADLDRADAVFNGSNCGITFAPSNFTVNAEQDPGDPILNANCGNAANLRSQIGFTENNLNVYYLNDPGARGWWCPDEEVLIVGGTADNETLSHELGHAFSLGHTDGNGGSPVDFDGDGTADFSTSNIMWGGATGRDTFSEGQCFRMNLNPSSALNDGVGTRNCPDATISRQCPWLGLDILPD